MFVLNLSVLRDSVVQHLPPWNTATGNVSGRPASHQADIVGSMLLATDISAREFMTGKILGAVWNAREMIIVQDLIFLSVKSNNEFL